MTIACCFILLRRSVPKHSVSVGRCASDASSAFRHEASKRAERHPQRCELPSGVPMRTLVVDLQESRQARLACGSSTCRSTSWKKVRS